MSSITQQLRRIEPKIKGINIWIIGIILIAAVFIESHKDFTATGTIALVFATYVLARDSSKNIKIAKDEDS